MLDTSNLYINISNDAKVKLTNTWGPELVLRCSCGDIPSHSMWGQYKNAYCPVCKQVCQKIIHEWGVVQNGS
jgi:hypothetical protein